MVYEHRELLPMSLRRDGLERLQSADVVDALREKDEGIEQPSSRHLASLQVPLYRQGHSLKRSAPCGGFTYRRTAEQIEELPQSRLLIWCHANQFHAEHVLFRPTDDSQVRS